MTRDPRANPEEDEPLMHPIEILIVDDELDSAELLRRILEKRGFRARTARTGAAALDQLAEEAFDVVLCDIGLPDMTGYDLVARVRADLPDRDVAFISITGHGDPDHLRRSARAGFLGHLVKPVDLDELVALLHRVGRSGQHRPASPPD